MRGRNPGAGDRPSDRLIWETVRFHRLILDLLQGKERDYGEVLYRVQQVSARLGGPEGDRNIGKTDSRGLERIANRLLELGIIEQLPRKVCLEKLTGKKGRQLPEGTEKVGWEMEEPKPGRPYCIHLDDGGVFLTGMVTESGKGQFRTQNSIYVIRPLEEEPSILPDSE